MSKQPTKRNDDTRTPTEHDEARILAMLLGEASEFEKSELDGLIAKRPELQAFRDEMAGLLPDLRAAHGHAGPSADADATDDEAWVLSGDKRAAVLAALAGGPAGDDQSSSVVASGNVRSKHWPGRRVMRRSLQVAAVVTLFGGLAATIGLFMTATAWKGGDYAAMQMEGMAEEKSMRVHVQNAPSSHSFYARAEGGLADRRPAPPSSSSRMITAVVPDPTLSDEMTFRSSDVEVGDNYSAGGAIGGFGDGRRLREAEQNVALGSNPVIAGNRSGDYAITRGAIDSIINSDAARALGRSDGAEVAVAGEGWAGKTVALNGVVDRVPFPVTPATPTEFETRNTSRAFETPEKLLAERATVSKATVVAGADGSSVMYPSEYEPPELPNKPGQVADFDGFMSYGTAIADDAFATTDEASEVTLEANFSKPEGEPIVGDLPVTGALFANETKGKKDELKPNDAIKARFVDVRQNNKEEIGLGWVVPEPPAAPKADIAIVREFIYDADDAKDEKDADRDKVLEGVDSEWEIEEESGKGRDELKKQKNKEAYKKEPAPAPKPAPAVDLTEVFDEQSASVEAVSTFSLNVSDASFRIAAAMLANRQWPEAATIREEEFINALSYGDSSPSSSEKISAVVEQAAHPFLQNRNLVRCGLRTASVGRSADQKLRLTVLLDTSGSMEREDRQQMVVRGLTALAEQMGEGDLVTLIGFAREPRLLADRVDVSNMASLIKIAKGTPAEGGTNLEAALTLAGQVAQRQYVAGGQNRIVLLTDGASNLGNADEKRLLEMADGFRQQGVAVDAYGVGIDGLDDQVLEALTRKGDGRYHVINDPERAAQEFGRALAGALNPAALDVKVQVKFNPQRVEAYRLIGFRKQRLNEQDFRDDAVDGGEIAAAADGNALYQVEVIDDGVGDIGELWVRFRDAATGDMVEKHWRIPYVGQVDAFDQAADGVRMAGVSGLFAEALLKGPAVGGEELVELNKVATDLIGKRPMDNVFRQMRVAIIQAMHLRGGQ